MNHSSMHLFDWRVALAGLGVLYSVVFALVRALSTIKQSEGACDVSGGPP